MYIHDIKEVKFLQKKIATGKQRTTGDTMIRIAIVEDEEMYVQQLTGYLKEYQKT